MELAKSVGIQLTVFDSESELEKIAEIWPTAHLLLRIKAKYIQHNRHLYYYACCLETEEKAYVSFVIICGQR